MARLRSRADKLRGAAGVGASQPLAGLGVYCLAGADYPSDIRLLRRAIEDLGLTDETVILNDTFAALRAGSHRPWGVGLICGHGINGCAVAPDGRTARFDGIGTYSGDWGGGTALGVAALGAAVRARDGRGPRTSLERTVPAFYGMASPQALTQALYLERLGDVDLADLAPVLFRTAMDGDDVARGIVDRLADELVTMAAALMRRLRMTRLDPDVVLAGGVFRTEDPGLYGRIQEGVAAVAPQARVVRLTAPPVLGAALIGLDRVSPDGAAGDAADRRARTTLERWRGARVAPNQRA